MPNSTNNGADTKLTVNGVEVPIPANGTSQQTVVGNGSPTSVTISSSQDSTGQATNNNNIYTHLNVSTTTHSNDSTSLAKSKKAQVLARFALGNFWAPVGSSIMEREEVVHVMNHLMSGPEGRKAAHKIDAAISGLPGLHGLKIVEDSLDKLGIPA